MLYQRSSHPSTPMYIFKNLKKPPPPTTNVAGVVAAAYCHFLQQSMHSFSPYLEPHSMINYNHYFH